MKRFLLLICIAFTVVPAEAQRVFSLDDCIQTGLERNYSIRIIRNEQQISDNNATPGNAGYLPTVDLSSGFSGTLNNNNNKLSDGTTEKTNGIHNETADIGLNVNWTVFDGLGIQATYEKLKELQNLGEDPPPQPPLHARTVPRTSAYRGRAVLYRLDVPSGPPTSASRLQCRQLQRPEPVGTSAYFTYPPEPADGIGGCGGTSTDQGLPDYPQPVFR